MACKAARLTGGSISWLKNAGGSTSSPSLYAPLLAGSSWMNSGGFFLLG